MMKRIMAICAVAVALAIALLVVGNAQQQRPRQDRGQRPDGGRRTQDNGEARTDVPVHPWDLILGRPTRDAIMVSMLAYDALEGFIEYETGKAKHKTPVRQFKAGEPIEIQLSGLKADTQHNYRFHSRADDPRRRNKSPAFRLLRFGFRRRCDSVLL